MNLLKVLPRKHANVALVLQLPHRSYYYFDSWYDGRYNSIAGTAVNDTGRYGKLLRMLRESLVMASTGMLPQLSSAF